MRVLHIAESAKGGVASYLNIIIPAQCQKYGADNVFVCAPNQHVQHFQFSENAQIAVFNASNSRLLSAIRVAHLAWSLVRNNDISIVHIHSTFAGLVSRPYLRLFTKAKILYCPHGWAWDRYSESWKKFSVKKLEYFLSLFTDKVICISEHEMDAGRSAGIRIDKLETIPNAISQVAPAPTAVPIEWQKDTKRILYVGRFDRQKGADLFLKAMGKLPHEYSAIMIGEFVVDADDSLGEVPKNTQQIGWLNASQLEYFYRAADCLVMPSRWEGFGLVALEAMRAGCVVIATRVGGLKEVVSHHTTGLLIEPESADAIAAAIEGLTVEKVAQMRVAAKSRVSTLFNADLLNARLFSMYDQYK
jgi:glycosyltransferase involved in cell wall biosynthesis